MVSPLLHHLLAEARSRELMGAATRSRRPRQPRPRQLPPFSAVTLRFAFPDDEQPLARLAAIDSSPVPIKPVLLAEVGGELRAALSLADGAVVADPFHPSTAVVELLSARALQLSGTEIRRRRRGALARLRLAGRRV